MILSSLSSFFLALEEEVSLLLFKTSPLTMSVPYFPLPPLELLHQFFQHSPGFSVSSPSTYKHIAYKINYKFLNIRLTPPALYYHFPNAAPYSALHHKLWRVTYSSQTSAFLFTPLSFYSNHSLHFFSQLPFSPWLNT